MHNRYFVQKFDVHSNDSISVYIFLPALKIFEFYSFEMYRNTKSPFHRKLHKKIGSKFHSKSTAEISERSVHE